MERTANINIEMDKQRGRIHQKDAGWHLQNDPRLPDHEPATLGRVEDSYSHGQEEGTGE